jgi:hypothetical protein
VIDEMTFEANDKEQDFFVEKTDMREKYQAVSSVAQHKTSKIVRNLLLR